MDNEVGARLKGMRIALGLTLDDFAKAAELPAPTIKGIEFGGKKPGGETLYKLCSTYPQFALWLTTGLFGVDQLSPTMYVEKIEIEKALEKVRQQGFTVTKN